MKPVYLAIGFGTVLSLFALFSIIKFAIVANVKIPLPPVKYIGLPVLKLTDVGARNDTSRSSTASQRYPYLTAIITLNITNKSEGWVFSCFGSLIATGWIVTAAHCNQPKHNDRTLLYRDYIQNRTNTHPILKWKVHPEYTATSTVPWHDIALGQVNKDMDIPAPVFFTSGVPKIQASVWKTIVTMDRRTYLTTDMDLYDVELVDPSICYELYGFTLDDTLLCVNMTHETDCFVTEFGPIFTPRDRVLGVLRLAPNDCDNKVAIFTNVTSYFEWISKEIGAGGWRRIGEILI